MKNILKRWLGVSEVEEELWGVKRKFDDPYMVTKFNIREEVKEAIKAAHSPYPVVMPTYWNRSEYESLKGAVVSAIRLSVEELEGRKVARRVNSEEFIDKIIDRIRNKQL